MRKLRRSGAAFTIAALAAAAAVWLYPGLGRHGETAAQAAPNISGDIATLLDQVKVVDKIEPVSGYDRSCKKGHGCVFGAAWNDPTDTSGCDTRSRVLSRDLNDVVYKPGTHKCKVTAGWLQDPYTGQRIDLADIDVDHVLPLARAWNAGASQWDSRRRQVFANDLTDLRAVSASANTSKGDDGLDEWLPPNVSDRCPYVIQYLTVAVKYELAITNGERDSATTACK
jgi:Protein of unknown function (DUF1524)